MYTDWFLLIQVGNTLGDISINVTSAVTVAVILGIGAYVKSLITKLTQKVALLYIALNSMDYALEKSLSNGYAQYRDSEKERLLQENRFVYNK